MDPEYGNVSGYFSGSVSVVNGQPRAVFPAVFGDLPSCSGDSSATCHMEYQVGVPCSLFFWAPLLSGFAVALE